MASGSMVADLLPVRNAQQRRSFRDVRQMVAEIFYRYRCRISRTPSWFDTADYKCRNIIERGFILHPTRCGL